MGQVSLSLKFHPMRHVSDGGHDEHFATIHLKLLREYLKLQWLLLSFVLSQDIARWFNLIQHCESLVIFELSAVCIRIFLNSPFVFCGLIIILFVPSTNILPKCHFWPFFPSFFNVSLVLPATWTLRKVNFLLIFEIRLALFTRHRKMLPILLVLRYEGLL